MQLRSLRVRGFQSFADSGEILLGEGINLVIGQNNSGKSSLLRSLQPQLSDDRHRSPARWEEYRLPRPQVKIEIILSGGEIIDAALRNNGEAFIPIPPEYNGDIHDYLDLIQETKEIKVELNRYPGSVISGSYPAHGLFEQSTTSSACCIQLRNRDGKPLINKQYRSEDSIPDLACQMWSTNMFYFSAERFALGRSNHAHSARLTPNADNLPMVLHTISGHRGSVFERLIGHLREIFSTVGNISVGPAVDQQNVIEIRVWPTEAMERPELSFPLDSSGTGVSQVIAMLTAVMTIDQAVIVIDEINSFLHPAAAKSLIRILKTCYSQHQYIISTHSSDIISFSDPSYVHLVRRSGYESKVSQVSLGNLEQLNDIADHLGISMSDVFAADRVIWVEGATEEICFPYLYNAKRRTLPTGVVFSAVISTGDFFSKKRDRKLIIEIYNRISSATSPISSGTTFSFDRENLSEQEIDDITRQFDGEVCFLPRRHFECYLLDEQGILDYIKHKDTMSSDLNREDVRAMLSSLAEDIKFSNTKWKGDLDDAAWLSEVDAARLIKACCENLTENRVTFSKKTDSLYILQRIFERSPLKLSSLIDYTVELVEGAVEL